MCRPAVFTVAHGPSGAHVPVASRVLTPVSDVVPRQGGTSVMFTGIVEELGVVAAVEPLPASARLVVSASTVLADVSEGASIAVNGVCLTVTSWSSRDGGRAFVADVMQETLDRSALAGLSVGDPVNLERAVRLADRLGGHLVQGHVDGVGVVVDRRRETHWEVVRISLPPGLDRYLVEKGSITVDGVSLTVVDVTAATVSPSGSSPASFTVSLIPTTLRMTTLGRRAVGDRVNLEVDVLAKYVEKLIAAGDTTGAGRLVSPTATLTPTISSGNGQPS